MAAARSVKIMGPKLLGRNEKVAEKVQAVGKGARQMSVQEQQLRQSLGLEDDVEKENVSSEFIIEGDEVSDDDVRYAPRGGHTISMVRYKELEIQLSAERQQKDSCLSRLQDVQNHLDCVSSEFSRRFKDIRKLKKGGSIGAVQDDNVIPTPHNSEMDATIRDLCKALDGGSAEEGERSVFLLRENYRLSQIVAEQRAVLEDHARMEQTTSGSPSQDANIPKGKLTAKLAALKSELDSLRSLRTALHREVATLASNIPMEVGQLNSSIKHLLISAETNLKDTIAKYTKECRDRRRIFNELQDLKGTIRVYCRVRPLASSDKMNINPNTTETECATSYPEDNMIHLKSGRTEKTFEFDHVYPPTVGQQEVFEDTLPLITSVVDGYNVCIFAYGQTGSGKTYTMEGLSDNPGVNSRALQELFRISEQRAQDWVVEIHASIVEVYNENVYDLLALSPADKKLELRHGTDGAYLIDLTLERVHCQKDVKKLMSVGKKNRTTFSTAMNQDSSRSHSVMSVYVSTRNKLTGVSTAGKLHLVDLAGSERVAKSDVSGDRLKEAQAINKSLSALGDVIAALASKSSHVPYRNSKLTYLLQDSLSGESKTLMFVQVSPAVENAAESLCSLNFAARVRSVELGHARQNITTNNNNNNNNNSTAVAGSHAPSSSLRKMSLDRTSLNSSADASSKARRQSSLSER